MKKFTAKEYKNTKIYVGYYNNVMTDVVGFDETEIIKTMKEFENEIIAMIKDPNNHGLLFHIAGYNGQLQSEIREEYEKKNIFL